MPSIKSEPERENWIGTSALFAAITGLASAFCLNTVRWPWNLLIPILSSLVQFGWSLGTYCLVDWISSRLSRWRMPRWLKRIDIEIKKPFSWHALWAGPIFIVIWVGSVGVGRLFSLFPLFLVVLLRDSLFKLAKA